METVIYFIVIGLFFYLMMKGCCGGGGHSHGGSAQRQGEHEGHKGYDEAKIDEKKKGCC
ncbi:MAG: hypothetical protein AAB197_05805 [Deltaproteobacteria bacterium]